MFDVFAPAVLAADGDPAREDAALAQFGIRAAKEHYDYCLGELGRHSRASAAGALNEALQRSARFTFLLVMSERTIH